MHLTVLVAGSGGFFQHGLCAAVRAAPHLRLTDSVSATRGGAYGLASALAAGPDVALLDLHTLCEADSRSALALCARHPDVRVVLVAGASQHRLWPPTMPQPVQRLEPTISMAGLAAAIGSPLMPFAPPVAAAPVQDRAGLESLTPREREILNLLSAGHSNAAMAQALGVTLPTVKFHVANLLRKLGASSRTRAVVTAYRWRLVDPIGAAL